MDKFTPPFATDIFLTNKSTDSDVLDASGNVTDFKLTASTWPVEFVVTLSIVVITSPASGVAVEVVSDLEVKS